GEVYTCPICGNKTEVYSRITGYYRPVQNWNDGKSQEFKDRKVYDIANSRLNKAAKVTEVVEETVCEAPKAETNGNIMMFATKTCPNCKQAEKLLNEAGIPFTKIFAEDNYDLATKYGIRQAPTLVVEGAEVVKIAGVGGIRKFISDSKN
ncbi:MAG: ribonucleoside triphosphate reductase, partial [Erysipelotrichaceae bacterium]|nr:ribonucleoside triphosphate reductase [Erysipelotrichaceae bacterium]